MEDWMPFLASLLKIDAPRSVTAITVHCDILQLSQATIEYSDRVDDTVVLTNTLRGHLANHLHCLMKHMLGLPQMCRVFTAEFRVDAAVRVSATWFGVSPPELAVKSSVAPDGEKASGHSAIGAKVLYKEPSLDSPPKPYTIQAVLIAEPLINQNDGNRIPAAQFVLYDGTGEYRMTERMPLKFTPFNDQNLTQSEDTTRSI